MTLIGMPNAARRAGYTADGLRRALMKAEVPLVRINAKAIAVEEADLTAFIKSRQDYSGMGRPHKQKQLKEIVHHQDQGQDIRE